MKQILQIKISLDSVKPEIWRRFLVEKSVTFEQLHKVIQKVMGWENSHMYEFLIDNVSIVPSEEGHNLAESSFHKLFKSPEFIKMLEKNVSKDHLEFDTGDINQFLRKNEKEKPKNQFNIKTPINKLINSEKQQFLYIYDLGDNWKHTVIVEKVQEIKESQQIPFCLEGERACPPEDCGGVFGYEELFEIKNNPKHPEYEERIVDWLGENFDPEHFDVEIINNRLKSNI